MKAVHFSTAMEFSMETTVAIVSKIAASEEMFKLGTRKLLCRGKFAIYVIMCRSFNNYSSETRQ